MRVLLTQMHAGQAAQGNVGHSFCPSDVDHNACQLRTRAAASLLCMHQFGPEVLPEWVQAKKAAPWDVATACAQAVQAATASCPKQEQRHLAHLACSPFSSCHCNLILRHAARQNPQPAPQQSHPSQQHMPHHQDDNLAGIPAQNSFGAQRQHGQQPQRQQQQQPQHIWLLPVEQQSILVASATIAGLWPDVLDNMDHAGSLVDTLLLMTLHVQHPQAQQAAVIAAAAILNRWPVGKALPACPFIDWVDLVGTQDWVNHHNMPSCHVI